MIPTLTRPNGISTLIACQNEEVTVGWSILSFLDFSDEIIVVDNGSTDDTRDICRELEKHYPEKVRFFEVPHVQHLHENRQFALEQSHYRWIVRGDADFVCYTDGDFNCMQLRRFLLQKPMLSWPSVIEVPQTCVHLDFFHTGSLDLNQAQLDKWERTTGCRLAPRDHHMSRIYQHVRGFRFARRGRWEGVRLPYGAERLYKRIPWNTPVWMHCNIKSDLNYLFRSERQNWRETGNFQKYPTLVHFLNEIIPAKYGTNSLEHAAELYVTSKILPFLEPNSHRHSLPIPALVKQARLQCPVYKINNMGGTSRRRVPPKPGEFWSTHFPRSIVVHTDSSCSLRPAH